MNEVSFQSPARTRGVSATYGWPKAGRGACILVRASWGDVILAQERWEESTSYSLIWGVGEAVWEGRILPYTALHRILLLGLACEWVGRGPTERKGWALALPRKGHQRHEVRAPPGEQPGTRREGAVGATSGP